MTITKASAGSMKRRSEAAMAAERRRSSAAARAAAAAAAAAAVTAATAQQPQQPPQAQAVSVAATSERGNWFCSSDLENEQLPTKTQDFLISC